MLLICLTLVFLSVLLLRVWLILSPIGELVKVTTEDRTYAALFVAIDCLYNHPSPVSLNLVVEEFNSLLE